MAVWIAQCLCPQRHGIVAIADEAENETAARMLVLAALRAQVARLLLERAINPWCGICDARSDTWRYELGRTAFATIEEAMPALKQNEAEQAVTGALIGEHLGPRKRDG